MCIRGRRFSLPIRAYVKFQAFSSLRKNYVQARALTEILMFQVFQALGQEPFSGLNARRKLKTFQVFTISKLVLDLARTVLQGKVVPKVTQNPNTLMQLSLVKKRFENKAI